MVPGINFHWRVSISVLHDLAEIDREKRSNPAVQLVLIYVPAFVRNQPNRFLSGHNEYRVSKSQTHEADGRELAEDAIPAVIV